MSACGACGKENPDEAAFCMACATPLGPVESSGETRKRVTIIFCDITGSTAIGERLDPESLRQVQSRYFDAMRGAIERHGGTVEKFIGDAVMAVFGIPQVHEDDALRAVRAAADMREALANLNKELERDRGVTLQVRIGVNTGEVVAGDPAAGHALVTGDAVNVAARLEQAAVPGTVLLGVETYRMARNAIDVEPVEPLELKGKREPVPAFRLIGVTDMVGGSARRLDAPIVGRERELRLIRQAYERAESDRACQLFTVLAPAGIGKSRLVEEFLADLPPAGVLRGRCLPYGDGITFFPIVEIVKQAAGLADFDSPDVIEDHVCAILEGEEHAETICGRVAQLLGVTETAAPDETLWAIRRFLEAVARDRPIAVVLDDVHWGQPTFLDLIEHIADWSRGAPILLLCVGRPELLDVRQAWGGGKLNATTISLEPLNDDECARLIANILGTTDLPPELGSRIGASAEGNPLFVEEMLAMLVEEGALQRLHDGWIATTDLSDVVVPPTIAALLAARLDQLSADERRVLQAASVVGKEFFVGAVRELVPEPMRSAVPGHVMSLVRKELVRPSRSSLPGEDAVRFRHILIRDAAYEAMPKELRADLHERFAGWLEGQAGDRLAEQEEIVGHHLEQAVALRTELGDIDEKTRELSDRAGQRLLSSGRRARARGDYRAALSLLSRAGPLLTESPHRAMAFAEAGELMLELDDSDGAKVAFEAADAVAKATSDPRIQAHVDVRRAWAIDEDTWNEVAEREALRALQIFETSSDEGGLALAWRLLAQTKWSQLRAEETIAAFRHAIEHAQKAGDRAIEADAWSWIAIALWFGPATFGEWTSALEEIKEQVRGHPVGEAQLLWSLADVEAIGGRFDEARGMAARASAILQGLGLRLMDIHFTSQVLVEIELMAGNPRAAEQSYRAANDAFDEAGEQNAFLKAELARILARLGDADEAEGLAMQVREAASNNVHVDVVYRSAMSGVMRARGLGGEAVRFAQEALEVLEPSDFEFWRADLHWELARALAVDGRAEEAQSAAREAAARFERKGILPFVQQIRTEFGLDAPTS